ncbi:MAG: nucleoside triphosphate pyrophosphohydrolase [Candidatus Latescibacteria bacterium]|nr:nucleoside triphosphate pyrophosphohydrolase [Candidatus Latescibacterota bacterium]MDP7448972.1 nucleoside triphosphate pyrophosphohydrolase [Candidatus Latescibacterota bacterium]
MIEDSGRSPFEELIHVMARLRAPDGCPWDREQNHVTLKPYLLEEAYEVLDAIDDGQDSELCSELGDVLLQVVFHAQVAAEADRFTADDVCRAIVDKLIRRHPHVFGHVDVEGAGEVLRNWEQIKLEERGGGEGPPPSALDGVPRPLPALLRAQRVQEKASRVGFDWDRIDGALDKVTEEVEELRQECADGAAPERITDEFGDLLFALVNVARFMKVVPEDALRGAVDKFDGRFRQVERVFAERGASLQEATLEEMDTVWDEIKNDR